MNAMFTGSAARECAVEALVLMQEAREAKARGLVYRSTVYRATQAWRNALKWQRREATAGTGTLAGHSHLLRNCESCGAVCGYEVDGAWQHFPMKAGHVVKCQECGHIPAGFVSLVEV